MAMIEFLSITADPALAARLWALPGQTVMVDLEIEGKHERQWSRDTAINAHSLVDVERLASLPERGPLMVRTNSLEHGALEEVSVCLGFEVERFMLPMFHTREDVDRVLEVLDGRAALTLLAETTTAVENLGEVLKGLPDQVDWVHIGLNDLALERNSAFLFEPVVTDEVRDLADLVLRHRRRFGFGGIGAVGTGTVPAERLIGEHVRVGSTAVILSRTFHAHVEGDTEVALRTAVDQLRHWEERYRSVPEEELEENHKWLSRAIQEVSRTIETKYKGT